MGQLSNLEMLALLTNELSGTLPTEIGLLTNVVGMWTTFNNLEGTVSIQLGAGS